MYNNGYGKAQDKPDVNIVTDNSQDGIVIRYGMDGTALWSARIGGVGADSLESVTTDSNGNVIVGGNTGSGTSVVMYNSDGTNSGYQLPAGAIGQAILGKYDSTGRALWIARLDSVGSEVIRGVSTDSSGNIYIACNQGGGGNTTAFNANGTAFSPTVPSRSGNETVVAKYNPNGTVLWLAQIASGTLSSTDIPFGAVADKSTGDFYVVGQLNGALSIYNANNFSTIARSLPAPSGTTDAYIVKYNTSGVSQWAARIVSAGADLARKIAIDSSGNLYIHGTVSATSAQTNIAYNANGTAFGTTPAGLGASGTDSFVVKYNSAGSVQWFILTGDTAADTAYDITVDPSSNVYITQQLASSGAGDTFLKKLDPSTGAVVWSARVDSDGADTLWGLTTDSSGNIYVGYTGSTTSSTRVRDTADTAIFTVPIVGGTMGLLIKYDSSGTPQWVRRIANANNVSILGLASGTMNDLYIVGWGTGSALQTFGQQLSLFSTIPNSGGTDGFVVKYNTNGATQWVARIASTGDEIVYGTATDSFGNMYVTGQSGSGATVTFYNADTSAFPTTLASAGARDLFIGKYSTDGVVQWVASVTSTGADIGRAVATDPSGNVYITGFGGSGVTVTANNSDGTPFSPSLANGGSNDSFVIKYNSSGFVQWNARIESTGADLGYGIATDSSGNVYVTGETGSGATTRIRNADDTIFGSLTTLGDIDVYIAKYNTSGTVQWIARLGGTGADSGKGVAVDTSGNVYITGQGGAATVTAYQGGNGTGASFGTITNTGGGDAFIVKYDTNGVGQWITKISSISSDVGTAIATDAFGNVYVVGTSVSNTVTAFSVGNIAFPTTLAAAGLGDAFIVKYNSSGVVQWVNRIASGVADSAWGIKADRTGNVYVVGQFGPASTNLSVFNADTTTFASVYESCAVVKYNTNGMAQWITVIKGNTSGVNVRSVDVDLFRNVYVGGNSISGESVRIYSADFKPYLILQSQRGTQEGFLIKYNSATIPQWASTISTAGVDILFSVATDSSGNIYAAGQYGTGTPGSINLFNGDGTRFTPTLTNAGSVDGIVLKYNSSGTIQWRARISGTSNEFGLGIATDSSGNVYVVGQVGNSTTTTFVNSDDTTTAALLTSGGAADAYIAKYDTNGTVLWRIKIASTTGDAAWSIATDSSGNVYATGTAGAAGFFSTSDVSVATITDTGAGDAFVVKYDTNGVFQWVAKLGSTAADLGYDIATDSSGNIFVTGVQGDGTLTATNSDGTTFGTTLTTSAGQDTFIVKFNTSGITQWLTRIGNLGSSSDIGRSITIDPSGNVIVGGSYYGNATANVYAADGTTVWATITSSGGGNVDAFVIKYDTNGNPQWVARIATASSSLETVYAVKTDSAGNVYAAGFGVGSQRIWAYNGGVGSAGMTIFGSLVFAAAAGGNNSFLVKYNSSGEVQWMTGFRGGTGLDEPRGLAVDTSSNLIMCGSFTESVLIPESSEPT